ncbi:MAG: GNAT family N-acetyltransferase [Flavobacteriaceae bacterium]
MENNKYIFKSERLGFRNWTNDDLKVLSEINSDPEVMEHFPSTLSKKETEDLLKRLINHYNEKGYTYYATEILGIGELIGFIGLAYQSYKTDFSPATDIGWRLKKSTWGKGYATEGAKRCLEYAFNELKLNKIFSVCTINNSKSENVMKKIGLIKKGEFNHPELIDYPEYEKNNWYEIKKHR